MARTVEQIDAEIEKLKAEREGLLEDWLNEKRQQAADSIQDLYDAGRLPEPIKMACTDKTGKFSPRRVFRMRKAG